MPLIKSTAHFAHDAVTKHTWNPNNDTVRYEAAGSGTYKKDMFAFGDTADVPHKSEHTHQLSDPQARGGAFGHAFAHAYTGLELPATNGVKPMSDHRR